MLKPALPRVPVTVKRVVLKTSEAAIAHSPLRWEETQVLGHCDTLCHHELTYKLNGYRQCMSSFP
jgi:hypothetical protein